MARGSLHLLRVQLQQNTTGFGFLGLSCPSFLWFRRQFVRLLITCCSSFQGANYFITLKWQILKSRSTQKSYSVTVTWVNVMCYFPPLVPHVWLLIWVRCVSLITPRLGLYLKCCLPHVPLSGVIRLHTSATCVSCLYYPFLWVIKDCVFILCIVSAFLIPHFS